MSVFVDSAAVRRAHHFKTHLCSLSSADKNRAKINLTHLWLRNGNACGRTASPDKQKTRSSECLCARVNFILAALPLFYWVRYFDARPHGYCRCQILIDRATRIEHCPQVPRRFCLSNCIKSNRSLKATNNCGRDRVESLRVVADDLFGTSSRFFVMFFYRTCCNFFTAYNLESYRFIFSVQIHSVYYNFRLLFLVFRGVSKPALNLLKFVCDKWFPVISLRQF